MQDLTRQRPCPQHDHLSYLEAMLRCLVYGLRLPSALAWLTKCSAAGHSSHSGACLYKHSSQNQICTSCSWTLTSTSSAGWCGCRFRFWWGPLPWGLAPRWLRTSAPASQMSLLTFIWLACHVEVNFQSIMLCIQVLSSDFRTYNQQNSFTLDLSNLSPQTPQHLI